MTSGYIPVARAKNLICLDLCVRPRRLHSLTFQPIYFSNQRVLSIDYSYNWSYTTKASFYLVGLARISTVYVRMRNQELHCAAGNPNDNNNIVVWILGFGTAGKSISGLSHLNGTVDTYANYYQLLGHLVRQ